MKVASFVITAVVVGLSGPAFAQSGSGQQTATNPPVYQPVANTSSDNARNWMVSGFLGTNFGSSRTNNRVELELLDFETFDTGTTSANFGAQFAYLGRGVIGGEFLADFSPNLGTFNNVLFSQSPNVNSYMFNAIAVAPFGSAHSWEPFISGGIGVVTINSDIFVTSPLLAAATDTLGTLSVSGSKFGWNLGGGAMAFSESNWGFRGDLRYFRTTSGNNNDVFDINNIGDGSLFTRVELSGISFWKANVGLSYRF